MSISLSIFFILFSTLNCLLENQNKTEINIYINYVAIKEVGVKGKIIVDVDVDNRFKTTTKNPSFSGYISKVNDTNITEIQCVFFEKEKQKKYYIICNVDNTITPGNYKLIFDENKKIDYDNFTISLIIKEPEKLQFSKVDKNIADLYSNVQNLIIDEATNFYELIFKYKTYNREPLIFNKYMHLKNCVNDSLDITCLVNKYDLLGYIPPNQNSFPISYYDYESCTINELPLIPINIINNIKHKEDIYVNITNLLTDNIDGKGVIVYETNVTNISTYYLIDKGFNLTFLKIKINNTIEKELQFECHFLKYDERPLILLCFASEEGEFKLKEINETIISNYSIKYNYIINDVKKVTNSIVKYNKTTGSFIYWYFPKELDFQDVNWIILDLYVDNAADLNGLTLTFDKTSVDLKCGNIKNNIIRCNVTKDDFDDDDEEDTRYYYIKRKNHLGDKVISFEVPPIKVSFIPPNGKLVVYAMAYSAIIFVIVLLLIVI